MRRSRHVRVRALLPDRLAITRSPISPLLLYTPARKTPKPPTRRPPMALPAATAPFVMLLLLVIVPTGCSDQGDSGGGGCFASLIGCAPPTGTAYATAFRASLAPLLAALPSAAAAAEGFAALRSQPGEPGRDRAHALGICFGGNDASGCHACLRAAVAAASEGCAKDTPRAGVWSDGCLLAYYADDIASSSASNGGTRSYTDGLERTLAEVAMALAQPKAQSLWRKAQSVMLFALAAIGAVAVVFVVCFLAGCYLLAETLFGNMAPAGNAGPQGQGDGLVLYVAGTNGQAHVWSLGTQLRFH